MAAYMEVCVSLRITKKSLQPQALASVGQEPVKQALCQIPPHIHVYGQDIIGEPRVCLVCSDAIPWSNWTEVEG
jgi:hypothetical protein